MNKKVTTTKVTIVSIMPSHLILISLRAIFGTKCLATKCHIKNDNKLPRVTIKIISTMNKTIFKTEEANAKAKLAAFSAVAATLNNV